MRVLGLRWWAVACSMGLGAVLGFLYVWLPWRGKPDPCTTLDDGLRACMPILVVAPPLWVYVLCCAAGALATLVATAAAADVHRRVT